MATNRVYLYSGKVFHAPYGKVPIEADISIEIDVGAIIRHFGIKAALNKSKRSRCLSGMVKIRAENVKKQEKGETLTLGVLGPLP